MTLRQSQVNLLTTDKFAQICRTTARTLRFYDQKGIFKPSKKSNSNSYRFYDISQARDFIKIKLLQNFQVPLSSIKSALNQNRTDKVLEEKLQEIKKDLELKKKEYEFLTRIKELISNQFNLTDYLATNNIGPFTLLCLKITKGSYIQIPSYIKSLTEEADKMHIKYEPHPLVFYPDPSFKPRNNIFEIALVLKEPNKVDKNLLPPNLYFKNYPKSKHQVFLYQGPYDYLPLIYRKIYDYLDQSKLIKYRNKVFERYIKDEFNATNPYEFETQILFPA